MPDEPSCTHCAGGLSRRQLLRGGASVGAVVAGGALLAACGSSSDASSNASSSGTAPAGGSSSTPPSAAAAAPRNALAKTSDIPVDGGKIFAAEKVVVTQPTKGSFLAFSAVCTHAGCTVAQVSGGVISCPCHGSMFSIKDGSVQGGPAPSPLAAKKVDVSQGEITLA
jgi:Rieske Fe-S protein